MHLLFLVAVLLDAYLAPRTHCLQQRVVTRCLQELLVQAFLGPLQCLLQQFLQHDMSCLHGGVRERRKLSEIWSGEGTDTAARLYDAVHNARQVAALVT